MISKHFNKKDEMTERLNLLNTKSSPNPKFNFQVLCSWLPGVEQNKVGKVMAKVKSKHSGTGKDRFEDWINKTEVEDIKLEVESARDEVLKM